jgi:hypothetical protein
MTIKKYAFDSRYDTVQCGFSVDQKWFLMSKFPRQQDTWQKIPEIKVLIKATAYHNHGQR